MNIKNLIIVENYKNKIRVEEAIRKLGYNDFELYSIGCNHKKGKTHLMNATIFLKGQEEPVVVEVQI